MDAEVELWRLQASLGRDKEYMQGPRSKRAGAWSGVGVGVGVGETTCRGHAASARVRGVGWGWGWGWGRQHAGATQQARGCGKEERCLFAAAGPLSLPTPSHPPAHLTHPQPPAPMRAGGPSVRVLHAKTAMDLSTVPILQLEPHNMVSA